MEWTICEKHHKKQKVAARVLPNANVCMNRYCPNSFTVMCSSCKPEHRDHSIKILTLEDIRLFVDRLLKTPFATSTKYLSESIEMMKKIKFIKDVRRKIDYLQTEIMKDAAVFIDVTESLIQEYEICRESTVELSEKLRHIENEDMFKQLKATSKHLLSQIDYNFKRDRLDLGNLAVKEKEEKRRKAFEATRRKIEEVKDYSMKVIEVILARDDESDDEQDQFPELITQKKKFYKKLKQELNFDKKDKEKENKKEKEKKRDPEEDSEGDQQQSKSTTVSNNVRKFVESIDCPMQTEEHWIVSLREDNVKAKHDLERVKCQQESYQKQAKKQILALKKQVSDLNQELTEGKNAMEIFSSRIIRIRENRQSLEYEKEQIFLRIIEVNAGR